MPRLRCPRCQTVVEVAPGESPRCPSCGFGSAAPTPASASTTRPPAPMPPPAPATPPPLSPFAAPSYEWAPPAPAAAPVLSTPTAAAPVATVSGRGWVLPVLWLLVALNFLLESVWISMLSDRATWTDAGIEPTGALVGTFIALDLASRIGVGLLVGRDLKALGAGRLKLSTVQATGFERTSPATWGVLSGIFVLPCAVAISMLRGHVRRLAPEAERAPSFADRRQVRDALRSPAYKETRNRQMLQMGVFLMTWVVSSAMARL